MDVVKTMSKSGIAKLFLVKNTFKLISSAELRTKWYLTIPFILLTAPIYIVRILHPRIIYIGTAGPKSHSNFNKWNSWDWETKQLIDSHINSNQCKEMSNKRKNYRPLEY